MTGTARSTFYELQRDLLFAPNIALAAFGLVHAHLFITDRAEEWLRSPYAMERSWTVNAPGHRVLYLHCLLPAAQPLPRVPGLAILTGDVVQELPALADDPPSRPDPLPLPTDPFLVPVCLAAVTGKPSLQSLWQRVHERLGDRVWSYLPRQKRLRRNGKRYVRRAFRALNEHCLVSQHLVRIPHLERTLLTMLVLADALLLPELRRNAETIEYYPSREGFLVRAVGGVGLLKVVIASDAPWWILEEERTDAAPPVRVRFEDIHSPAGWRS